MASGRTQLWWLGLPLVWGCSGSHGSFASTHEHAVHDSDGRHEVFETSDAATRQLAQTSVVALMSRENAELVVSNLLDHLPTWQEKSQLCDGEPFAAQPSAAFCSGVLVQPDLVLTASHCLTDHALEDIRVVRGYAYMAPRQLEQKALYSTAPAAIVAKVTPEQAELGADYVWLALEDAARAPLPPMISFGSAALPRLGQHTISVASSGGVPLKIDDTGVVRGLRPNEGLFTADTDTFEGASGSGVFDEQMQLLGILARGARDYEQTADGCYRSVVTSLPTEQFTSAQLALDELCSQSSSFSVCSARTRAAVHATGGCFYAARPLPHCWIEAMTLLSFVAARRRRRR